MAAPGITRSIPVAAYLPAGGAREALEQHARGHGLGIVHTFAEREVEHAGGFGSALLGALEFATGYDAVAGLLVADAAALSPRPGFVIWLQRRLEAAGKRLFAAGAESATAGSDPNSEAAIEADFNAAWEREVERQPFTACALPRVVSICLFENRCFARCRFCPQFKYPERTRHRTMDWALFTKIVGEIPPDANLTVRIGTGGEPLTYPKLHEHVRYLADRRPRVTTEYATIGITLDRKQALRVIESGLSHLMISFNAPSREDYRWFTGIDAHDRVLENMRRLVALRDRLGSPTPRVSTKIMTLKRWEARIEPALARLGTVADQAVPSHVQYYRDPELANIDAFAGPEHPLVPTCSYLSYVATILPNGDYQVCCAPDLTGESSPKIGNARDSTLAEIWRGETYRRLRRTNAEGVPVIASCRSCRVDRPEFGDDLALKAKQRRILGAGDAG